MNYDGVDYVPISQRKALLIQFLNIAGLGPIFGAIMGAMYGPVVFIWIVIGTIFGGAVHDYFSGMISLRRHGSSLSEWIGDYLGTNIRAILRVLIVFLMIMVGAVFTSGPAKLLEGMTGNTIPYVYWAGIILLYYIIATLFPIDKIIGRIYPIFGFALLFMAVGILVSIFISGDFRLIPEIDFTSLNQHPHAERLPLFPMLFITVACGAISGFHATQAPLMSRCMKNEREGRNIFYGAMVLEGIVALIWAAAGTCFYEGTDGLHGFMAANGNNAAATVADISRGYLGKIGSILAMLGVVAAPITSADTGFRAARLIIADATHTSQRPFSKRLIIAIPLFIACFILLQIDFEVLWRYFAWCNQTLAVFTLWAITVYLALRNKAYVITLIPALFMTSISVTYIFIAKEGFSLPTSIAYPAGVIIPLLLLIIFWRWTKTVNKETKL